MPVTNDTYDQLKIDKLKYFLEAQAAKGQAKPFEIFVDNLKVVSKTEDPGEFDSYEFYLNEDTEKVRILIYNSSLSPRNDQYCFMVQTGKTEKSGNGLGEIEGIIQEKLAARDREYEVAKLREELDFTRQELQDSEAYSNKLEKEIVNLKENKFKLGNINMAELAGIALESIVRRNPQILSRIPGGEALAGMISQDNQDKERLLTENTSQETTAKFEKDTTPDLTEQEKKQLSLLRGIEQGFNEEQALLFNQVLTAMVETPAIIPSLLAFIKTKK